MYACTRCPVCFVDENAREDDELRCDEVQEFVAPDSDDSASIAGEPIYTQSY